MPSSSQLVQFPLNQSPSRPRLSPNVTANLPGSMFLPLAANVKKPQSKMKITRMKMKTKKMKMKKMKKKKMDWLEMKMKM
jgi:hypothetical protein